MGGLRIYLESLRWDWLLRVIRVGGRNGVGVRVEVYYRGYLFDCSVLRGFGLGVG